MKTSAIIRIVIWSIVAVALTGVLLVGLSSGFFEFGGIHLGSTFSYADSEHYLIGGNSIDKSEISEIEINWVAGEVEVLSYEGSEVVFAEQAGRSLSQEDRMRFLLRDGKLTIQFSAPRTGFRIFSSTPSKRLEVKVPKELAGMLSELEVDAISASVRVQGVSGAKTSIETVSGGIGAADLSGQEIQMETVSGSIKAQNLRASELSTETVSGSTNVTGAFHKAQSNSVSGSVLLESSICPEELEIETVSGAVRVAIPENDGFTARYNTTGGQFACSFPTTGEKKRAVYKDGGAEFSFSTVSGVISIEQR